MKEKHRAPSEKRRRTDGVVRARARARPAEFPDKISVTDTPSGARVINAFVSAGETSPLPSIYIYTRFALHYNINIARNRRARISP